jgi:hypothetical protein
VTIKWQLTADGRTLSINYAPRFRRAPKSTIVHVPPAPGLTKVIVNGNEHATKPGEALTL